MPKQFPLTKKRKKWVGKRTTVLRGEPLNYPAPVQARYVRDLEKLTRQVLDQTEKEIIALFKSETAEQYFAEDASIASKGKILTNKLIRKVNKAVSIRSKTIAERMVRNTDKASQSQLHSSLKELSGGLSIKTSTIGEQVSERLKASIDTNVSLIKSIQSDYLDKVKDAVNRSIMTGNGLQDLVPFLKKQRGITTRRARMIALDQTRKAYNSLNAARMEDVGVDKYQWVHTGGSVKPREHHIKNSPSGLNAGIFSLNDPPVIDPKTGERGIPGQLPNCKCRMKPVIVFDEGNEIDS